MKYLVETLGDYGLFDLFGRQEVFAHRPTVVAPTGFIEGQKGRKLRVIAVLSDAADDAPLAAAKDAKELEAAIAALPSDEAPKPKAAPSAGKK